MLNHRRCKILQKLCAEPQKVQDTPEENLGEIECGSGNVEEQCNTIKECVLHALSDWSVK